MLLAAGTASLPVVIPQGQQADGAGEQATICGPFFFLVFLGKAWGGSPEADLRPAVVDALFAR